MRGDQTRFEAKRRSSHRRRDNSRERQGCPHSRWWGHGRAPGGNLTLAGRELTSHSAVPSTSAKDLVGGLPCVVLMHDCSTEYFRSWGGARGERHPEARLCRGKQDGEEPRRDLRSYHFFMPSAASIGRAVKTWAGLSGDWPERPLCRTL